MNSDYVLALLGGALVGLASLLMLLFNGKILGVSGIVGGILQAKQRDRFWRYAFVVGLLTGGITLNLIYPITFSFTQSRSFGAIIFAGLLVGYGTRLGNGCTSGHGICGVSRFSPRSIMATLTFIATGALTVFVINHLLGGSI